MDDGDFDEFDEFDRGGFDADLNEEWEAMEAAHEASKEKPVEPEPEPELVPAPPVIAVAAPPPPPPAPKPKPSIGVYAVPPQGKASVPCTLLGISTSSNCRVDCRAGRCRLNKLPPP